MIKQMDSPSPLTVIFLAAFIYCNLGHGGSIEKVYTRLLA